MADNSEKKSDGGSQSSDQYKKLCKRKLESWREVLIHLDALLTWDKPYYPAITAGTVTLVFLLLWYFDPSVLTTVSIIGILSCLLDYLVPLLGSTVFDSSKWTGTQEKKYEKICSNLVESFLYAKEVYESFQHLKETKPYLYVLASVGTLLLTAWIGNLINNLFLLYLIVLLSTLAPGIVGKHSMQSLLATFSAIIGQSKKKK